MSEVYKEAEWFGEDITFQEWLDGIFNHSDPEWYREADVDYPYPSAPRTVILLTETFEKSGSVLLAYSDAQVNTGLWFIQSTGGGHLHSLLDSEVPFTAVKKWCNSVYTLYRDLFAVRCTPHLSYLDEPGTGALNSICYMWWDCFPTWGSKDKTDFDQELLRVMEQALTIPHVACQESVLHGLGHWENAYPAKVHRIIDDYLTANPSLKTELRDYATWARTGRIQ